MRSSTRDQRVLRRLIGTSILISALVAPAAVACGLDTDCLIGERTYRVALPDSTGSTAPNGAVIFIHGYRGKSAGVMSNAALTTLASKLGVVFAAAQADGIDWNLPGVPSADALEGVDELAYFDALSEDLVRRFGVDRRRIVVTGFSAGGMMVWHLACHRGDSYAGFVPLSGTFWEPIPTSCPTPSVKLIHYHGTEDKIVPLAGRPIKDSHQGDVYEAVELLSRIGGYRPVEAGQAGELLCTRRMNDRQHFLELCLFTGGHTFKAHFIERAWQAFGMNEG